VKAKVAFTSHLLNDQAHARGIRLPAEVASPLAVGPQSGFRATDSVPVGKYPVVSIAKPAAQTRTRPTESRTATSDLMRNTAGIQRISHSRTNCRFIAED
jgi:hypothetical protein